MLVLVLVVLLLLPEGPTTTLPTLDESPFPSFSRSPCFSFRCAGDGDGDGGGDDSGLPSENGHIGVWRPSTVMGTGV